MSASQAAVVHAPGETPRQAFKLLFAGLVEWLTPEEGWDSLVLLMAAVAVVAWSVREAGWVETPGIFTIAVLSCLVGFLLAKIRAPWPVAWLVIFPEGLAIGLVVVMRQTASLVEGQSLAGQVAESRDRLGAWLEAAVAGGISTDLLPFSLALLALAWLLGYIGAWFLFRRGNVWVGVLLAAVAILTNLSALPESFGSKFFLFMLPALLLVARVSISQRNQHWRTVGISFGKSSGWLTVGVVTVLSAAVLVAAAGLPLKVYVWSTAVNVWNFGRSPIEGLEDDFARLFSGIASRKDLHGRFLGTTLPFQGKISFGGDVVLWATSEHPSYWLSRTYSRYTPQGWIAGKSINLPVGPNSLRPPRQESFKRVPVFQSVELGFDSDNLFSAGNLDWVSHDTIVEQLAPLEFDIEIIDSAGDSRLPEHIRGLAKELRRKLDNSSRIFGDANFDLESHVSSLLPEDLYLVGVGMAADSVHFPIPERVTIARKVPEIPDLVAWKFTGTLEANNPYSMRSLLSSANNRDLRTASSDYSGFIKDHYLQLPSRFPQRVRDLAKHLTRDARTPLDKALAIEGYLRGDTFEYSRNIEAPPQGADGVEYFLFETRKGYSDYFSSAMAVMLRTVGVPTRLAAGYAPGSTVDRSGRREVKDSDSHGWVQVNFPGYGWIDFEPTKNWPAMDRGERDGGASAARTGSDAGSREDCAVPLAIDPFLGDCYAADAEFDSEARRLSLSDGADLETLLGQTSRGPQVWAALLAIGAALLAAPVLIAWLAWTRGLAGTTPTERLYSKMSRLGTLVGVRGRPHQTPFEYATSMGNAVPAVAAEAQTIANAFASSRYGKIEPTEEDVAELSAVWKGIRRALLGLGVSRLVRAGKA